MINYDQNNRLYQCFYKFSNFADVRQIMADAEEVKDFIRLVLGNARGEMITVFALEPKRRAVFSWRKK